MRVARFALDALVGDVAQRVGAELETGGDTRQRLIGIVRIVLELPASTPAAARLLLVNLGRAGELPEVARAFDQAVVAPIRRLLDEGMQRGEIVEVDVPTTATALFGAVVTVGMARVIREESIDTAALAESLVNLVWKGISK
jgi:AcrR family transcriptional regulator